MQTESTTAIEESGIDAQAVKPPSPGKMLRASRKQRGLSKKEVADTLHITAHYVNALEHDQYDKLPGAIFAKGYMKRYAEIMELEQAEVLAAYEEVMASDTESASAAQAARSRSRNNRNKLWVGGSLLLFAGLFTGLWFWNSQQPSVPTDSASSRATPADSADSMTMQDLAPVNTPVAQIAEQADAPRVVTVAAEEAPETAAENVATGAAEIAVADAPQANDGSAQQQEALSQAESQAQTAEDASLETHLDNSRSSGGDIAADVQALPVEAQDLQTESQALTSSQPLVPDASAQQSGTSPDNVISVEGQGTDTLRISFSGASWVEVNDGEENQIYRDLRVAGDVLEITGVAPFSILLGDAPLTRLTFNGNEIDVSDNIRIDNSARLTVGL